MATCPECDFDIDVDEYDVDKGDIIHCPECGSSLEVTSASPPSSSTSRPKRTKTSWTRTTRDEDDEEEDEEEDWDE